MANLKRLKKCSQCEKVKHYLEFSKHKPSSDGLRPECKLCRYSKPSYSSTASRKSALKSRYNLTLEDYDKMFEEQKGFCAICGERELSRRLSIDHNHVTGKV